MDEAQREQIAHWFAFHPATPEQMAAYQKVREAAVAFAEAIAENTPKCADQSAALRKVREAAFTANSAIALGGK